MVYVTYSDLLGPWGAAEGPAAVGLGIPTWVNGGMAMAAGGAYADGIGGTAWCCGWYMSAAMVVASSTMGAVKVRRGDFELGWAPTCSFSKQAIPLRNPV